MTTHDALMRVEETGGRLAPVGLVARARTYAAEAKAPATRRVYCGAFAAFVAWCQQHGQAALPAAPEVVAVYITSLADAGRRVPSIELALAAIAGAHRAAGLESPRGSAAVREVATGIRRTLGVASRPKAPVLVPDLRAMLAALPAGRLGVRDRALLLVGFASALRRGELVALNVADVAFGEDGLTITLRRSKTDQEGEGRTVGVPFGSTPETFPVRALRAWLAEAGIIEGPIFRGVSRHGALAGRLSGRGVARVVQRAAAAVGLEAATFGGHSLRAGLATAVAKAGKSERAIMAHTAHRSVTMMRRYIREASVLPTTRRPGCCDGRHTTNIRRVGTLTGAGLEIPIRYRVTRTTPRARVAPTFGGAGRFHGGQAETIEIQLLDLPIQTAAVLERVASLTLILAHGSQLPITLLHSGAAVMAGNAVWTEDET